MADTVYLRASAAPSDGSPASRRGLSKASPTTGFPADGGRAGRLNDRELADLGIPGAVRDIAHESVYGR